MEVGEKFNIEGWPIKNLPEKFLEGEIKKIWKEDNCQFFILECCDWGFAFKGIICGEKCELYTLIAERVKRNVDQSFITNYSTGKLNWVILANDRMKKVAFLCGISKKENNNSLFTIEGTKTEEEVLKELFKRFDRKKEEIKDDFPKEFLEEINQNVSNSP